MRHKIGLIVEGNNEWNCYPSFIHKILGYNPNYPIINAGGIGNILRRIDEYLLALVQTKQPETIIVTVDLKDAIDQKFAKNCLELKTILGESTTMWLDNQRGGSLENFLPSQIIPIIAEQSFGTWLIADQEGLKSSPLIDATKITEVFVDIDKEVNAPTKWLASKTKSKTNLKRNDNVCAIRSCINPCRGKQYSRSLRKFCKEIETNSIKY